MDRDKRIQAAKTEAEVMQVIDDVLREQAIDNVRTAQERGLQLFRGTLDQDALEVAEHDRLKKEARQWINSLWKEHLEHGNGARPKTTQHRSKARRK
jgi:hypothetical protein